jgi:hypothetical protein
MDPLSASPAPHQSRFQREAIQGYISMGFEPQAAEYMFETTKRFAFGAILGIGLAVLVSLSCDGDFWAYVRPILCLPGGAALPCLL